MLGTVGGDDTVLVIASDPAGGDELAGALLRLAERRDLDDRPATRAGPTGPAGAGHGLRLQGSPSEAAPAGRGAPAAEPAGHADAARAENAGR